MTPFAEDRQQYAQLPRKEMDDEQCSTTSIGKWQSRRIEVANDQTDVITDLWIRFGP
jgi:hypothetical protein